jgi:hypothetical protein
MNGQAEFASGPSAPLGAAPARSLPFALVWSSEVTLRFGELSSSGRLPLFVAALGCAALTLGAVGIVTDRRTTTAERPLRMIVAALLASGPAAVLARVLQGKTHHRALGGVTFALLAGAIVLGAALVVWRLLGPSGSEPRPRSAPPRRFLTIMVVASVGAALGPFTHELGSGGSSPGRWLAQDLAIGAALSGLMVLFPCTRLPSRVALLGAAAWTAIVGTSVVVVALSMPLRAILLEHAPVALGFVGGL